MTIPVYLRLFAMPRLESATQTLELPRRKALALLAYLVVSRQAHSREGLAAMFFADHDRSRAFAYLRNTLWTINKSIGEETLEIDRETVRLHPDAPLECDVQQFRHLILHSSATGNTLEALEKAIELYQGDFMHGFTLPDAPDFEEWQFFQSQALRYEFSTALQRLLDGYIAKGAFSEAIGFAHRWLALDNLHEPAHRMLMQLYAWSGQRSAALRQYRDCVRLLKDELDAEPETETVELAAAIQENRLSSPTVPETVLSARVLPASLAVSTPFTYTLPAHSTPFISREEELSDIARLLADAGCRLLTLLGPGGIGKTRLALQIAANLKANYADGVCFVPLTGVNSAGFIVGALADALGLGSFRDGDPKHQIFAYLLEKKMLLVLDNFEHLIEGAGLISEILQAAPQVKVIATSRQRLQLQEEWIYEIRGLNYPAETGETKQAEQFGAVQLFLQTARRVRPDFMALNGDMGQIVRICRLVEGMPLGIELAAAWLQVLSCAEIADEISRSLDFLSADLSNLPARHRSLRCLFESSWEQLSEAEKHVLSRLSMFRGGFRREAALAVAEATLPLLLTLVNKSLVRRTPTGRYDMHELLRQFAEEKLNFSVVDHDRAYDRYTTYYTAWLHEQETRLKQRRQREALDEVELEIDNIRCAWNWAVFRRDFSVLEKLHTGLALFYLMRSRLQDGKELFAHAVAGLSDRPLEPDEQIIVARIELMKAVAYMQYYHQERAEAIYEKVFPILEHDTSPEAAFHFVMLGDLVSGPSLKREEAEIWARRALALYEAAGDEWGCAHAYRALGNIFHHRVSYADSGRYYRRSLELSRKTDDLWSEAEALKALGEVAYTLGTYPEAEQLFLEGIAASQSLGDLNGTWWAKLVLAECYWVQGKFVEAEAMAGEGLQLARQLGQCEAVIWSLNMAAARAIVEEDLEKAERTLNENLQILQTFPASLFSGHIWTSLYGVWLRVEQGRPDMAQRQVEEVLRLLEDYPNLWGIAETRFLQGEIALLAGDLDGAHHHIVDSIRRAVERKSVNITLRALGVYAQWLAQSGETEKAVELFAFVIHRPENWYAARHKAQKRLAALRARLSVEDFAAAQERGRNQDFDQILEAIVPQENVSFFSIFSFSRV